MKLDPDGKAKDFLIEKGYNPDFGARPLRRAIERYIEDPLSENILQGEFTEGQKINVTHAEGDDKLTFTAEPLPPDTKEEGDLAEAGAETT